MSYSISEIAEKASQIKHHALLLLAKPFGDAGLASDDFAQIAKAYCHIHLTGSGDAVWEAAALHPDVFIADRERNILRLEEVASLRSQAIFAPNIAKKRLFFIDRCERLNVNAANAILKTIEEPNIRALFLFTAHSASQVLPTISSRCQKIPVKLSSEQKFFIHKIIEEDDWEFLVSALRQTLRGDMYLQDSIWDIHLKPATNSSRLAQIMQKSYQLAKKYSALFLQEAIIKILAEEFAGHPGCASRIRFVINDIRQWQAFTPMHPSSELWLAKILTYNLQ